MNTRTTKKLTFVERLADGKVRETPLENALAVSVAPSAGYALKDLKTQKTPKGMVLLRQGLSLLVMLDDQQVAELSGFFSEENRSVAFYTDLAAIDVPISVADVGNTAATGLVTQATPPVSGIGTDHPILWMNSTDSMGDLIASAMDEPSVLAGSFILGGAAIVHVRDSASHSLALKSSLVTSTPPMASPHT
jgi:hypothetical protein